MEEWGNDGYYEREREQKKLEQRNDNRISIGDIIKLKIEGCGSLGDSFGHYERVVVFVKGAKPQTGEIVQVKVTYVKENCAFAEQC
jgi:predicted RNA-binding protein with TRAM domain